MLSLIHSLNFHLNFHRRRLTVTQKAWIGVGYNKREQAKEAAKDLTTRFEKDRQKVLDVWEVLTEDERADLLGSFVQAVEITEKESVTIELLPAVVSRSLHSQEFALNSPLGAGRLAVVNYPPIQFPDFEVSRISRRAWKPLELGKAAQAQE